MGSGSLRQLRHGAHHAKNLRRNVSDNVDNPTYIFTKRRVGYRMPEGETRERETE